MIFYVEEYIGKHTKKITKMHSENIETLISDLDLSKIFRIRDYRGAIAYQSCTKIEVTYEDGTKREI